MPRTDELRRDVEELALRLVVAEPAGTDTAETWLPVLRRIRECAIEENATEVLAAAAGMIDGLSGKSATADLQQGVLRLQAALETNPSAGASSTQSLAEDRELLSDFILESREHLAAIETHVLTLERDPCDAEGLNAAFRGFHTIKGLAGFLELWEVQKLAHEVEAILDRARNGQLTITSAAIDVVLESADVLRQWLVHLDAGLQNRPSTAPVTAATLLAKIRALSTEPGPDRPSNTGLAAMAAAVELPTVAAEPARMERAQQAMSVKVDTRKLDYLVDMAGEMVIAESLVRHDPELSAVKTPRLQRNMAQMMRITAELQKTAMAMRLVPIGPLFRRMARLVRDLSRQFGKTVEMHTEGDDIELDRTIVEELADPLMHMVRNSLDHGIESPEERAAQNKAPCARVMLRAHHQSGQVVIEIADDGRGLNLEKILEKATQRGLVTPGQTHTEAEIYNLIFEPGFTTAAQVTSVSGRGVGMDVVRRHVEKLRGRIEVHSTPGAGSTFSLKLPLTLAIIDGLVVGVGTERYIVPLFAVREMFRPGPDTVWTVQNRGEMALVRNNLLPVLRLYRKFGIVPRSEDPCQSVFLVAEAEGHRFCLAVDELIGKQEVVIKSLGETFKHVPGVAGGAILGDGRVGLILDLERLVKD